MFGKRHDKVLSFRPLAGYELFLARQVLSADTRVFVPSRGTSCFTETDEVVSELDRFRPLAGYELFRTKYMRLFAR